VLRKRPPQPQINKCRCCGGGDWHRSNHVLCEGAAAAAERNRINYGFIVNIGARRQPGLIVAARIIPFAYQIVCTDCVYALKPSARAGAGPVNSLEGALEAGSVAQLVRRRSVGGGLVHKTGLAPRHFARMAGTDAVARNFYGSGQLAGQTYGPLATAKCRPV